jgi:hypothetical protein
MTDENGSKRNVVDRHSFGVFPRKTWLRLLRGIGFRARIVVDPWRRECFLATRPVRA